VGSDPGKNNGRGLDSRLKEAEVYSSMGLLNESLKVYHSILLEEKGLAADMEKQIKAKIASLEKEIKIEDRDEDPNALSDKDRALLQDTIDKSEKSSSPIDRARAYREQGLFESALEEYEEAFSAGLTPDEAIAEVVQLIMDSTEAEVNVLSRVQGLFRYIPTEEGKRDQLLRRLVEALQEKGAGDISIELEKWYGEEKRGLQARGIDVPLLKFISADFSLGGDPPGKKVYHLEVLSQSEDVINLLVSQRDADLLGHIREGDTLRDMIFYAQSAIRKMTVNVKGVSPVGDGTHKGKHMVAVGRID
jgi:tetratricopeptide (TPR) repeat protein